MSGTNFWQNQTYSLCLSNITSGENISGIKPYEALAHWFLIIKAEYVLHMCCPRDEIYRAM